MRIAFLFLFGGMLCAQSRPVIGPGGVVHETNTFNAKKTTLGDFETGIGGRPGILRGDDIIRLSRNAYNTITGFITGAEERGLQLYPSLVAGPQTIGLALSHQSALLSPKVPQPKHFDPVGEWILKNYAPANAAVSFHFAKLDVNMFTPVIRRSIREATPTEGDHYTVYLPAYDDRKLVPLLMKVPNVRWHIFSKHTRKPYHIGKLSVYPVNKDEFAASLLSCKGILCGAGFETPAEALYLGKKLLVVPMKKQYEQHYNSAALKSIGVPVLKNVKKKRLDKIREWVEWKNVN